MTYLINTENTGLTTNEQAAEVARILAAAGHDVAFTRDFGLINFTEECPCSTTEWENALIAADKAFPTCDE